MLQNIIIAENKLDVLLPVSRLEESPSAELMAAARLWSQLVWDEAINAGPVVLKNDEISQGLTLAPNPAFILGVHRSGTTLVRNLLDGHPNLVVLPSEGTYFTNLETKMLKLSKTGRAAFLGMEWLRRLANPINQPPYWVLGRSSDTGSRYLDFARYFMAWWKVLEQPGNTQWPHMAVVLAYATVTNNLGAKLWVDKTPVNERFLNRIWKEMPRAKVIHIIREPMNTLTSRKKMEPSLVMRNALEDIKLSFKVVNRQLSKNDEQYLLIKYEELCESPEEVTNQMASFLGITTDDVLNKPTVAGMPVKANSAFAQQASSGQVLKPHQHPQQNGLNTIERRLIAGYLGKVSAMLNYPLAKIGYLRKFLLRVRYRLF